MGTVMQVLEPSGEVRLFEVNAGELLDRAGSGDLFRPLPSWPGGNDAGPAAGEVHCHWCRRPIDRPRPKQLYHNVRCRQAAWWLRQHASEQERTARPLRFAYADPPYPGLAKRFYGAEPNYAGEVDHGQLVASLLQDYDGWALSTGAYALRQVLPLCPEGVRVCAWTKPIGVRGHSLGLHNCWEPLIVSPGRRRRPAVRDWLAAQPARGGGTLMGRKPLAFCAWLFRCLGMQPGDKFDDLFPGTGIVGRAWASLEDPGDA